MWRLSHAAKAKLNVLRDDRAMFGRGKRLRTRRLGLGVVAAIVASATVVATLDADSSSLRHAPGYASLATSTAASGAPMSGCGAASTAITASVDAAVARGIYAAEIHSNEVSSDRAHVIGSQALRSALAGNDRAAVYAAVHAIVYAPHWHIVRLRVLKAGRVLVDVGGPDVIAPVSGTLRWKGRPVGSYVMSVQDDAGYV